ncbi:MAG TPA: hypothetical protein PLB78_14470, partial [Anaerolineae bacterium]|nr:hypothetical protein [Anaerolineae bacterium]
PPGKSWLLIAGSRARQDFTSLDEATADSNYSWQGSPMTRRGDICVVYCVRPRSTVHSIWRALSDGFSDPFFYYYSTIRIGRPLRVPELPFSAIRDDPVLGKNPSVRASLVGASGKPLTADEYDALLRLLSASGCDISSLPRPRRPDLPSDVSLASERDVEALLLEPLLKALGYTDADWLREMPVRMGRGERVFPDYALLPHAERGEESAAFVIEAKLHIATEQQLVNAYRQCKSYALRLQCRGMALAAAEGFWIFRRGKNGFSIKEAIFKSWRDIGAPDGFREVALAMSRDAMMRTKSSA